MSEKKDVAHKMEILLDDETANGVYANMAVINHSEGEFIIDFIFTQPQAPKARVRSRVVTSPRHLKRLIQALQENLQRYEAVHGVVTVAPEISGGERPVH